MEGNKMIAAVAVIAVVTALLRFLPFFIFGRKKTPAFVEYLGEVLPYAIMGMLVVYCLRGMSFGAVSGWIPYVLGTLATIIVHVWKRNTIYSILSGTIIYMVLIRLLLS